MPRGATQPKGSIFIHFHRPRQAVGFIYVLAYLGILFAYVFYMEDDGAWAEVPHFTATVAVWFALSLAVKASMVMDRTIELLNLFAVVGFLSIAFTYYPQPGHSRSIELFCYYLNMAGGPVCDVCDFLYESVAKQPEEGV